MTALSPACSADLVTQAFGCTDYTGEWARPDCPGGHFHAGLDLGWSDGGNNHLGEPVRALRDGHVLACGPLDPGNGAQYLGPYAPCIQDDRGRIWEYGHVQAVHVQPGDQVAAGQVIASIGSLGASSGGHLHIEVRTDAPIQGPPWTAILDPTQEVLAMLSESEKRERVRTWFIAGLGREPAPDDLDNFAGALRNDASNLEAIATSVYDSPEGQAWRAWLQSHSTPGVSEAELEQVRQQLQAVRNTLHAA